MAKTKPIFFSALLLTGVNLLLRLVGTSFQVYLSSRIGAEGIGLLQLVLSVSVMSMVAGMAGIRTATMYLTAEEIGKKRPGNILWVLSGCCRYSILCSCTIAIILYFSAPFLSENWLQNSNTADTLRLCAFFLPVNCLNGVLVGYFTGANRITTLAAIEIVEQICNMVCTVFLLSFWAQHDPEKSCMAVVMGSGIGSCLTLASLILLRYLEHARHTPKIPVARRLLDTAVPLAIADDLRTGISTVENLIVPKRLALYPGTLSPLATFGIVCGMVFPILTFPTAILFGLTELLVPELARCRAAGSELRIQYLVKRSLRVSLIFGTLCSGILFLCAEDLCQTLYHSQKAGEYLRWFSILAVMLYCDAVTDAMIKGLGQQKASVRYNIATNIMDVTLLYFLLPRYGISGYYFSFLITHAINFLLSIHRLLKIAGIRISAAAILLTFASGISACIAAAYISNAFLRSAGYTIILFCLLFLTGVMQYEDIRWFKGLLRKK